jgi:hypothetical protein
MGSVLKLPTKNRPRPGFQADLKRALKAAANAGHHVDTARIDRNGSIELVFRAPAGTSSGGGNPWDE